MISGSDSVWSALSKFNYSDWKHSSFDSLTILTCGRLQEGIPTLLYIGFAAPVRNEFDPCASGAAVYLEDCCSLCFVKLADTGEALFARATICMSQSLNSGAIRQTLLTRFIVDEGDKPAFMVEACVECGPTILVTNAALPSQFGEQIGVCSKHDRPSAVEKPPVRLGAVRGNDVKRTCHYGDALISKRIVCGAKLNFPANLEFLSEEAGAHEKLRNVEEPGLVSEKSDTHRVHWVPRLERGGHVCGACIITAGSQAAEGGVGAVGFNQSQVATGIKGDVKQSDGVVGCSGLHTMRQGRFVTESRQSWEAMASGCDRKLHGAFQQCRLNRI
jgi:hypothetical protein